MLTKKLGALIVFAASFSTACNRPAPPPPPLSPTVAAREFVSALNADDVARLAGLAGLPFRVREQEWTSAPDGSGFVLGQANERVAASAGALDSLLRSITTTVQVEDTLPSEDAPPKEDLLSGTLRDVRPAWSAWTPVLFRRGEGDVEHVAILGVDPRTGKVMALYVN
jgi:hypothetical protein